MEKLNINEEALIADYLNDKQARTVAIKYNCSDQTVYRILKRHGIDRTGWKSTPKEKSKESYIYSPLSDEQIRELIAYYQIVKNNGQTAKHFGYSRSRVAKYIKKYYVCLNTANQRKIDLDELRRLCPVMTQEELAKHFDCHIVNIQKQLRKIGCKAKPKERVQTPITWHYTDSGKNFVEKYQPDFEFIAYKQKRYKIKCKVCGHIVERGSSTIRKNICKCDKCQEQKQYEIELQKERVKLMRLFYAIEEQKKPKTCIVCGKEFHSQYAEKKYCSDKCKKSGNHIRNRCKKYGVYYDPEVTPIKIFERDHYRCMICGLFCNTEDDTWNGHFGAMSPTVDHIIALANGGTHTWDNVQCAHAICNSYKRDITL